MRQYSAEEELLISQYRSMNKDIKKLFKETACAFSAASRKEDNSTAKEKVIPFSPEKS